MKCYVLLRDLHHNGTVQLVGPFVEWTDAVLFIESKGFSKTSSSRRPRWKTWEYEIRYSPTKDGPGHQKAAGVIFNDFDMHIYGWKLEPSSPMRCTWKMVDR